MIYLYWVLEVLVLGSSFGGSSSSASSGTISMTVSCLQRCPAKYFSGQLKHSPSARLWAISVAVSCRLGSGVVRVAPAGRVVTD